jgi:hypothetical protein
MSLTKRIEGSAARIQRLAGASPNEPAITVTAVALITEPMLGNVVTRVDNEG